MPRAFAERTALSDTLDLVSTLAAAGQFVVVAATALAAIVQLRHMRASNELTALLSVDRDFHEESLQRSLRYVQFDLAARMQDAEYRSELSRIGFVDVGAHPEMEALNWFNRIGALVKNGLVDERTFLDVFSRLTIHYWQLLEPSVALLRRKRGDMQYENFEYVARRARDWLDRHPHGTYPRNVPRLDVPDPWLAADSAQPDGM